MAEIRVKQNVSLLWWYSIFMAFLGTVLIGGHAYFYAVGQLESDWYLSFFLGALALFTGAGHLLGFYKPKITEIVVDDTGIKSNTSVWDSSFTWKNFKHVELHKNKIEVQYAKTGLKNSLGIPWMIRIHSDKMKNLEKAISDRCSKENVEFESKLKT
ncbi:hypothetical protein [Rhodohalobacter barkolensis]|uniref:YcxB-like protein domain-containing protein n=1 Tax=Rhodohalobacter barkolensis TaxID=2053187 RepID=A0A2N0VEA8_9BACT|nr:hypothetical protein [Rhodohalobacter barkolensis]PKD42535.1 hypothetical protein CWD77_14070 [Rhodohalobacter barkolensis]